MRCSYEDDVRVGSTTAENLDAAEYRDAVQPDLCFSEYR